MMDIIVSAKNLELTPSMRATAEEKLIRFSRYWSAILRIHIEIVVDHHHRHGQVVTVYGWVEVPGHDIRATTLGTTYHEALDRLVPKLERAIIRSKERRRRD